MKGSGAGATNSDYVASWLELESDPGLFTLLVDDFGVKGVQVEEIYDLTKPLDNSIFGFIFLFKWIERSRSRRNKSNNLEPNSNYCTDSNIVNKMFFAHQIVPNSCATHALLSVLLNCKLNKYLDLGDVLDKFKKLCDGLAPEIKGLAIGNQPKLAQAHNSYAKPDSSRSNYHNPKHHHISSLATSSSLASSSSPSSSSNNLLQTSSLSNTSGQITINSEIFHFICFVPINGRLYELDGLKPYPVDHGPIQAAQFNSQLLEQLLANDKLYSTSSLSQLLSNIVCNYLSSIDSSYSNWTSKFKNIILQRLSSFNSGQQNHEIRFNLMAVVPDRMCILKEQIDLLNENRKVIVEFSSNIIIENESISPGGQQGTESDNFVNTPRQLRSSKSSNSNLGAQVNSKKMPNSSRQEDQLHYEVLLNLSTNENIQDLNKNWKNLTKINFSKFKQDLIRLLEKFDLVELSRIFKIEKICLINNNNSSSQNETSESILYARKLVSLNDLKLAENKLANEIESEMTKLNEEIDKRNKYKIEALRRKHIYDEFILTYLKILAENGKLEEIVKNSVANGNKNPNTTPNQTHSASTPNQQAQQVQSNNSSFYISPNSLFLPQQISKKQRKK